VSRSIHLSLSGRLTSLSASLARVAALHQKWLRCKPEGALSVECQELNALHSQSVDGAKIKIPDRLSNPPETKEPFILDLLADAASKTSLNDSSNLSPCTTWQEIYHKTTRCSIFVNCCVGNGMPSPSSRCSTWLLPSQGRGASTFAPCLPYLDLGALTVSRSTPSVQLSGLLLKRIDTFGTPCFGQIS
jgi:hypothetical protein